MKNIYIMDEYMSSQKNGLGVFVKQLIASLKSTGDAIHHLDVNTDEEEFTIQDVEGIQRFCFPKLSGSSFSPFSRYAEVIDAFLKLHIEDSEDNIFILNHSPCEELVLAIKESHPLSKVVFVIHDFRWTFSLCGNADEFRNLIEAREKSMDDESLDPTIKHYCKMYDEEVRAYGHVDKVICLSEDSYKMLLEVYKVSKDKIALISNGLKDSFTQIDEEKKSTIRSEKHINTSEKILIYVGRINKIKGGLALLASFTEILKVYPNCRLVIIGDLLDKSILELSKNISSKITFTGHISKAEILDWYRIADIGLIPSYIEQCSYSAMEMMMYSLPIVTSDGYGVRCMFEDGVNGKVAKIGSRETEDEYIPNLTSAILEVLSSDKLQEELKKGSREIFKSRYEVSHMQKTYIELIESL